MKKFILLYVLTLSSCATNQRPGLISKMLSYTSGPTKALLEKSPADKLEKIIESGFHKLTIEELYALNHFRVKIIEASRENCLVILEDRTINSSRKEKALKDLSDQDFEEYAKIMANVIRLGSSYDAKIPVRPNKKEFDKAFEIALDAPTSGIMPDYLRGIKNAEDDQCWLLHKALRYADEKRNRISEIVVRYMGM